MKKRFDPDPPEKRPMDRAIASLMGLGDRSVQKSYYPQLQKKIRELEESRHQYFLLAENISDVIWLLDMAFHIVYISPSIRRISGYDPADLQGRPFTDLLIPEHAGIFLDTVSAQSANQEADRLHDTRELQLQHRNSDGSTTWTEMKLSCLMDEIKNRKHILGISRDITARKKAERERESLQAQLVQAQKMESVGTLAGGISHDFNNMLTVINGYADMGLNQCDPSNPLYKHLSRIQEAGRRAADLTRQLLAFSRKQVYQPMPLNINRAIASMDSILRRLIGEDIRVETRLEPDLPPVLADQSQIEQIFTNLVVNARDALKEMEKENDCKRIIIETGRAVMSGQAARQLRLPRPGPYVFFSVSDNGMGMDRVTQERIFEPFFTTKEPHKGTGLGLAMAYGIIKQNRGGIRVYSEPGRGTLFKIYWPVADKKAEPDRHRASEVHSPRGSERILIVEDDEAVCRYTAAAVGSLGYKVYTAANGRAALDWLGERLNGGKAVPDLAVTDLVMPELNGKQFAEKAVRLVPGLKVIFVSGYTDEHIAREGILEPGVNFLQKPYTRKALGILLRQVLDD